MKRNLKPLWIVLCDGEPDYVFAARKEAKSVAESQGIRWSGMKFTIHKYVPHERQK